MNDYVLSCCSTADLSKERFAERNIKVIYFHFMIGNEDYLDDCGESVAPKELFDRMGAGEVTKTSQVTVGEYISFFEDFLQEGKDILHISLSSGISGSYNSAVFAKNELEDRYPERKIYIVDSLGASSGYGLIMETLADMRDGGMDIDSLYKWIENNKLCMHHWFFSTDLTYYIRGGRISKAAGVIGTVLNICPLLNMDNHGVLTPREKLRGKKKAMKRAVEMMCNHATDHEKYSGKCYMCHSDCYEDASELASMIEINFPKLNGSVEIWNIGATIGSHTGPGTISIFFWGDKREE